MNAPEKLLLPDTQALPDARGLAINKVGVKGLRYPVVVRSGKPGVPQHTIADLAMYVGLPPQVKGTHMSRFVEILELHREPIDRWSFQQMFADMLDHLDAKSGYLEMRFPYFIRKTAPVSGVESLLDYEAALIAEGESEDQICLTMELSAPVTSLCPCSKKISDYGAHNQRSRITLRAEVWGEVSLEELARIAEDEASCAVYGLLKRPDEKHVTERAYDNPKFVEDLVRDLALRLQRDPRIGKFTVASENYESIHNHSAYAEISGVGAASRN
ncbi:MAG: GTP cyclohydrolase I FolE2 [Betaproteobacteria bacterium]|nr:GTP cyclohydrolase I FolE2 [Betaproteobacteria bacterium]